MEAALRLRPHVRLESSAGGARVLDDQLYRAFDVGPIGATLVRRIDGTRTVADLVTCDEDATILRRLFLLNLVEGAGDGIVARLARVLAGDQRLDYSILDGARFECQGSGGCCQNYVFGPLEDEDVAKLEGLPIADAFPHLAGAQIVETFEQAGVQVRYLKSVEDRCVFLDGDSRCGLHARFGAAAKPKLCRLYPVEHIVTFDGIRLFDKGSCASFARSERAGPTLVDELPRIVPLLRRDAMSLWHPAVTVDEYPCDFGHFDRFAKAALALVKQGYRTAAETLRAIARGARGFAHVLRSFPLQAGEPEAAVTRFLEIDPRRWYEGEPDDERVRSGALSFSEIFAALTIGATQVIADPRRSRFESLRLLSESAELFEVCAAASTLAVAADIPVGDQVRAVLALPVSAFEVDEVLRISLRQQLFGNGVLVEGHLLAALVRMAIIQVMAVTGARLRAYRDGRHRVRADDLSWGHMLAVRDLSGGDRAPALLAAEDRFTELLEALPAVLSLDASL